MELEAVFDHLNIVKGERLKEQFLGLAVELPTSVGRAARGRGRDMLFVHLLLSSREAPGSMLYKSVIESLVNAYYLSGGSVTAALRQAIRSANETLMRHNTRMEGVSKQQGAVTCAVLREEEIFIAQAGQARAFLCHQGRLERLPPRPPGHITPLGVGYGVDTRFYHSWVHPGDVLLLANPGFSHADDVVGPAIIYEGVTSGIKNLAKLAAKDEQVRLLMVEFVAAAARDEARPEPKPTPPPEPEPDLARPSAPSSEPVTAIQESVVEESSSARRQPPSIEIDVGGGARKVASGVASGLARLTGGIGRVLERLFGAEPASGQAVRKGNGPAPAALGILALAIPVMVTLIVITVYLQRGRAAQFQEFLLDMDRESQMAQAAGGDKTASRAHWQAVLRLSEEAYRLRPSSEIVGQFREQARDALDVLDEVTRLRVRPLHSFSSGGRLSGLTAHNLAVYVLDSELDRVYKRLLASDTSAVDEMAPETLMFKTQAAGSHVVGQLVDIVWFPKSGKIREDTVAILDAGGLLLRYRPSWGDVLSSQLVTPAAWSNPVATAVYGDNLYVLDTGAAVVWRYEARDGGYPEEPSTYLIADNEDGNPTNDIDLTKMLDLTIDRDGHLYLLSSDGVIFKFFGGDRKPFSLTDLDEPLVAPQAIFSGLTGLNPFFYIADPGSGRILQTTQQGLYLAQYRALGADLADPFTAIQSLYVIETPVLHIYATSGDELIVASLESGAPPHSPIVAQSPDAQHCVPAIVRYNREPSQVFMVH